MAAFENVALWHERDISHSSVERVILPDSCILTDYMLGKTVSLIDKLLVYPENMKKNLERTNGLIFSQPLLLALVQKGLTREKSYRMVQAPSMACWKSGEPFQQIVKKDKAIREALSENEIDACFDLAHQLRNVDVLFKRVGLG